MVRELRSNDAVHGAVKTHMGLESQRGGHLGSECQDADPAADLPQLGRLQLEDHAADLPDGRIEVVDGSLDLVGDR